MQTVSEFLQSLTGEQYRHLRNLLISRKVSRTAIHYWRTGQHTPDGANRRLLYECIAEWANERDASGNAFSKHDDHNPYPEE